MTTSHRPTFNAAIGGAARTTGYSKIVSAKDQIGFTQIKYRELGQNSQHEMNARDLRQELELKERSYIQDTKKQALQLIEEEENKVDVNKVALLLTNSAAETERVYDDADVEAIDDDDDLDSR
jgi:hypothetical protein